MLLVASKSSVFFFLNRTESMDNGKFLIQLNESLEVLVCGLFAFNKLKDVEMLH